MSTLSRLAGTAGSVSKRRGTRTPGAAGAGRRGTGMGGPASRGTGGTAGGLIGKFLKRR